MITAVHPERLCLSIRQPWAWLIVRPDLTDPAVREIAWQAGYIKPVENRDWWTSVRGWVGIHAAQKFDAEGYSWVRDTFPEIAMPAPKSFDKGGIVGRGFLIDCAGHLDSPWFFGKYGFVFSNTEPLAFRPCRGMLGFFCPTFTTETSNV